MQYRALRPVFAPCTLTALVVGCQSDEPANIDIETTVTHDTSSTRASSHASVCGFGYGGLFG